MLIDSVSYTFYPMKKITVFIHRNGQTFSIADIEIGDRDLATEEDWRYMQNLAEEVAFEQGYEFRQKYDLKGEYTCQ